MAKPILGVISAIVLVAFCAASGPAGAADVDDTCRKRLVTKGFPNRIQKVAGLTAIRIWSETAKATHGADFSMWHNADGSFLKCGLSGRSKDYYSCVASGRPCLASTADNEQH